MAVTSAVVGVGSAIFGVGSSVIGASNQADAQQQMLGIQAKQQKQRQDLFEIEQQRKRIESLRQGQVAASTARANAVGQGAQFGSGLLGGIGEIQGETNYNILGINQNTMVGENLFGLDQQLTDAKINSAQATSMQQMGQSMTSFGGMLVSNMGEIGRLSSGFGNPTPIASSTAYQKMT